MFPFCRGGPYFPTLSICSLLGWLGKSSETHFGHFLYICNAKTFPLRRRQQCSFHTVPQYCGFFMFLPFSLLLTDKYTDADANLRPSTKPLPPFNPYHRNHLPKSHHLKSLNFKDLYEPFSKEPFYSTFDSFGNHRPQLLKTKTSRSHTVTNDVWIPPQLPPKKIRTGGECRELLFR